MYRAIDVKAGIQQLRDDGMMSAAGCQMQWRLGSDDVLVT